MESGEADGEIEDFVQLDLEDEADATPTIPGFANLTPIGKGGFSTVYAAEEEDLHRRVAIKLLVGDEEATNRLEREVKALGILENVPHVVSAHSIARSANGHVALIMPLFETSLSKTVKANGKRPWKEVAKWSAQLAEAIDTAHRRGVIHRDVKPENVLLDSAGNAHLADFGIAALESLASGTATVMSISPPHAPPERLNGINPGDESGDIYSLASTLYFALVGKAPFGTTKSGGAAGLIMRIINDPVPRDPGLAPRVWEVLAKGLSKDSEERYRSARELAAELSAALEDEGESQPGQVPLGDASLYGDAGRVVDDDDDVTSARLSPEAASAAGRFQSDDQRVETIPEEIDLRVTPDGVRNLPPRQPQWIDDVDADRATLATKRPADRTRPARYRGVSIAALVIVIGAIAVFLVNRMNDSKVVDPPVRNSTSTSASDQSTTSTVSESDLEKARIKKVITESNSRLQAADQGFSDLWKTAERVNYDVMAGVVNGSLGEAYNAEISLLENESSPDRNAQKALDDAGACARAKLTAFHREATFDLAMSNDENEAAQKVLWDQAGVVCDRSIKSLSQLG